jgi:ferric-dicitrate binding protein FerR (iron transport regulator)
VTQPGDDRLLNAVAELAREEHLQLVSHDLGDAAFTELSEAELQSLASAVAQQLSPKQLSPKQPSPKKTPTSERQSAASKRQSPARARWGRRLGWLTAAAAVLCGLWLLPLIRPPAERATALVPQRGTKQAAEPGAEQAPMASPDRRLALPDGSTLALAEHTDARVVSLAPHEVRVQLEHGSVQCEVAHDPERRFVVAVGAWEVVVKGTRFTVSSGPDGAAEQVVVSVERGLVEVRQAPDRLVALLGAGQRWSSTERSPAAAPPVATAPAAQTKSTPSEAAPLPGARPAPSARSLFERADAERLAGHAREAAAAFDELRRRFPSDARAGYAAFMLGRIRLDTLGDPSGAAEALAFAIAHPGGGFFLEDAEARRVEALAQAGRANECQAARAQFLSRYPQALRAPFVAKLCANAH